MSQVGGSSHCIEKGTIQKELHIVSPCTFNQEQIITKTNAMRLQKIISEIEHSNTYVNSDILWS